MLKGTLNSSLWLIRTKNLYSDRCELSVVYCNMLNSASKYVEEFGRIKWDAQLSRSRINPFPVKPRF